MALLQRDILNSQQTCHWSSTRSNIPKRFQLALSERTPGRIWRKRLLCSRLLWKWEGSQSLAEWAGEEVQSQVLTCSRALYRRVCQSFLWWRQTVLSETPWPLRIHTATAMLYTWRRWSWPDQMHSSALALYQGFPLHLVICRRCSRIYRER